MKKQTHTRLMSQFLLTFALMAMLVLVNSPAQAWGFKKKEKKEESTRAINLDKHPPMKMYRGILRADNLGDWYLDKHPLSFNRNSRISDTAGSEGGTVLVEGKTAKVTAANIDGVLIVHRVTMFNSNEMMERGYYNVGSSGADELETGSANTPR